MTAGYGNDGGMCRNDVDGCGSDGAAKGLLSLIMDGASGCCGAGSARAAPSPD